MVLPSPRNGEVSLAAEKKPVNSVAFYHPRGLFFDICVYIYMWKMVFFELVWFCWGFFPAKILPRMIEYVCVCSHLCEGVRAGREW